MHSNLFIAADLVIIAVAWLLSTTLLSSSITAASPSLPQSVCLVILCLVKMTLLLRAGLHRAILRYAGLYLAASIVRAVTLGSLVAYVIIFASGGPDIPVLFLLDWLLTLFLVGASRFLPRYILEVANLTGEVKKKAIIYGAGDIGEAVARNLLKQKSAYIPVAFLDDDPKKHGRKVHNIPIVGDRSQLASVFKRWKGVEFIIAFREIDSELLRELIKKCRMHHVVCRIAPKMSDMMDNDLNLKNIDISDLLRRDPKDLDLGQIDRFLRGKVILITGAAGSIGAELVRQALRFSPKKLICVDVSEYGLYTLEEELQAADSGAELLARCRFVLLDVCDAEAVDRLTRQEQPHIVFHAAAYKHVPLVETNPFAGVLNNLQSTISVAAAAHRAKVEKFVLISTDKAVRPTSIMGTTKRICELYVQNMNPHSKTEFVAVRFGNVLGSSGSVIPKFVNQIKQGGPVTVTHPAVTRYFMLIQEAVALVLQAASIGHGGEIFILNMGKPVKIKDMAEDLIFLAGKEPYKDIDIRFSGLRPGEKLYEELLIDETEKKTQYENIMIGKVQFIHWEDLEAKLGAILQAARAADRRQLLANMKALVPEIQHVDAPQTPTHQKVVALARPPLIVDKSALPTTE